MCWNENISLNTFIFTSFVLLFILYNNKYTQYKCKEFEENYLIYFFYLSFTIMQLFEYFLWISVKEKNQFLNRLFSILGFILIMLVQPILSMVFISNQKIRKYLIIFYIVSLIIFCINKYINTNFSFTTTVENGHLKWNWLTHNKYELIFLFIWLFCTYYGISFYYKISGILLILFYLYYYNKEQTWGSMWCWSLNAGLFVHLIRILIIMPFYEYNKLC